MKKMPEEPSESATVKDARGNATMPPSLAKWPGYVLGWLSATGLSYYERMLEPFGMRAPHVSVLVILDAEGGMVQARLSERLRIDRATMVGVLNDLESNGSIARTPHPTDRRAFNVIITESGRKALLEIVRISEAGNRIFFGVLTEDEYRAFCESLLKLATQPIPSSPSQRLLTTD